MEKPKFYFAYDKRMRCRVVHVLKGNELVSLVSGERTKLTKKQMDKMKNDNA